MHADAAIIGGTGINELLEKITGEAITISTSFGDAEIKLAKIGGKTVALLPRHGKGHKLPPHSVPYKRNAAALKQLQPKRILATAAVGSLHREWLPGTFVLCTDVIDLTCRNLTLFETGVQHTDMSDIFSSSVSILAPALRKLNVSHEEGVYLGLNGPRYETPAEIRAYSILGADVVGMTASTEAIIMREAGLKYECLAIVTNLAAGLLKEGLEHEKVTDVMHEAGPKVMDVFAEAVKSLP